MVNDIGPSHSKAVSGFYYTNQLEQYKKDWITVGDYTYGTPSIECVNGLETAKRSVVIGKYSQIAQNVRLRFLMEHPQDRATTYPFPVLCDIYPSVEHMRGNFCFIHNNISIGNEVWIGSDVTILGGTNIGDGAIIGSHSVVKGNVPPYALFVGNRAKLKRFRYPVEMIEAFLRIKWWEWPHEKVVEHAALLSGSPKAFIEKFDTFSKDEHYEKLRTPIE